LKKLGKRQGERLAALRRHGRWPGGWNYGTPSATQAVLDSLVKLGLARIAPDPEREGRPSYRLATG
jgi:hypothetical protein